MVKERNRVAEEMVIIINYNDNNKQETSLKLIFSTTVPWTFQKHYAVAVRI